MSPEVTIGEMPSSINVPARHGKKKIKENNGVYHTQAPLKFKVCFFHLYIIMETI